MAKSSIRSINLGLCYASIVIFAQLVSSVLSILNVFPAPTSLSFCQYFLFGLSFFLFFFSLSNILLVPSLLRYPLVSL